MRPSPTVSLRHLLLVEGRKGPKGECLLKFNQLSTARYVEIQLFRWRSQNTGFWSNDRALLSVAGCTYQLRNYDPKQWTFWRVSWCFSFQLIGSRGCMQRSGCAWRALEVINNLRRSFLVTSVSNKLILCMYLCCRLDCFVEMEQFISIQLAF